MKKSPYRKSRKSLTFVAFGLFVVLAVPVFLFSQNSLFQNSESEAASTYQGSLLAVPLGNAKSYVTNRASTLKVHTKNDIAKWNQVGVDENKVFKAALEHKETNASFSYKNWTMKIGKGGQIYSLFVKGYGETIPYQRTTHGMWVDEVFQQVISSTLIENSNTAVDWDIHEAGVYRKADGPSKTLLLPHSLYNFSMPIQTSSDEKAFTWESWPQHAHLPFTWKDNQLLYSKEIRDLGDGVIEITHVYSRWGGETPMNHFVSPWFGVRPSTLPFQVVSKPDGTYMYVDKDLAFTDVDETVRKRNETNGWIAFLSGMSENSVGLGVIFSPIEKLPIESKAGIVRLAGKYDAIPADNNPDGGGKAGGAIYKLDLKKGERIYIRYYLVLGTLKEIQAYGNKLSKLAIAEYAPITAADGKLIQLAIASGRDRLRRGVASTSDTLIGYTERHMIAGAQPLFQMRLASGAYVVTSNPYTHGYNPSKETPAINLFLGWAVPANKRASGICYMSLGGALGTASNTVTVDADASKLYVRCAN